ncbi:hypothetical protein [Flavobacterium psychrotolerans]|uniref:Uncharacterized protein n=1 Tax=Flavobacterium psychrotolerans TaxID=2169410 RepID=A0A2U1JQZ8_9FLAO|nr:hypothetical protein [Flavobacterium psychrotolerans]PWA07445.1 hypothetical protein DB895_01635 [Flavobacterium psychrotolerans]
MSTQNQINIEIPQTIIDGIMQKLQECKTDLEPYLQGITSEECISFFNVENKTVSRIQKKSSIDTNPDFAPSFMNKIEFYKDEELVSQQDPFTNLATFFSKPKE